MFQALKDNIQIADTNIVSKRTYSMHTEQPATLWSTLMDSISTINSLAMTVVCLHQLCTLSFSQKLAALSKRKE